MALCFFSCLMMGCHSMSSNSLEEGKQQFKEGHYSKAYNELLPLAARGNADAQYAVGYMYYYGKGVDENKQLAKHWLTKAANQGQPNAVKALNSGN